MSTATTCYNLCGRGNDSIQTAPATTDTQTMGSTVAEQLAAVNNVCTPDLVIGNGSDGYGVPSGTDSEQNTLSKTSETKWESDLIEEYLDPENGLDNSQTSSPMPSLATISNSGISDNGESDSGEYENCKSGKSESDEESVALNDIELADIFQYCDYEFIPRETCHEFCPEWLHNEMNHEDYGFETDNAPNMIGDVLGTQAQLILDMLAPYPGNSAHPWSR
ncbi:hypothetical protein L218DRAFT_1050318 [Marasmius fiardii PR-910]|nr:hypothetical protein L218DRAFT_1050318 [Marasmius fiardii PR-910]